MTSIRSRSRLVGVALAGTFVVVASAAPVAALERDDGDDPGEQISTLEALLLFGVVPIALMLAISLFVWLPGMLKGNKGKPAINWDGEPEWYGGPDEEKPALAGGGQQALTGTVVSPSEDAGGSSGRW
ncbi:MAG: hypothetical protein ACT4QG_09455 [Sporichthyaceae bacterium]